MACAGCKRHRAQAVAKYNAMVRDYLLRKQAREDRKDGKIRKKVQKNIA
jgi:hypothetical protein